MPGRRPERVAEQIKEEVSLIIAGEMQDPRVGFVTVTDARISPDLRHARIFVSVLGNEQEAKDAIEALNHAARFIRRQLGSALRLKRTPELHFIYDETVSTAARIEQLLKEEGEKARERERDQEQESEDVTLPGSSYTDQRKPS